MVCSDWDHCSTGPSAVVDQSNARMRAAISLLPANTDSIRLFPSRLILEALERKPGGQLNLASSPGGCQDLAHVSGKITRRILKDGISVAAER
jgi:hypothetical protein